MSRKQRRAAEHASRKAARKAARKAGFPTTTIPTPTPNPTIDSVLAEARPQGPCQPDLGIVCGDPDCVPCKTACDDDDDDRIESVEPVQPVTPKPEISEARLAANRLNATHSTGPTSPAGRQKVSTNAVKTALTGRTVLLPFDNVEAYQTLLSDYLKELQPVGPIETGLVQSLVDTCWRLERIPGLEYALIENGHNQLGHENAYVASTTPQITLELHIRQVHEKTFRNLHLQENRLMRRRDREMKELRALQQTRKAKESEELKVAAQAALVAQHQNQPFHLEELGFVFSTRQFSSYMARLTPAMKQNLLKEALTQATEPLQAAA